MCKTTGTVIILQTIKKLIIVALFSNSIFAQNYLVDCRQLPISKYLTYENRINSEQYTNFGKHYTYSPFQLGQPYKFIRKNINSKPRVLVHYDFSIPDSIVRNIKIEIDSINFLDNSYETTHNYFEKITRLKDFSDNYDKIKREFTLLFGKPEYTKMLDKTQNNSNGDYMWTARDSWSNDSLTADLSLTFTDIPTIPRTYRIRANINYNNKNSSTKDNLSSQKVFKKNPKQDSISRVFISLIFKEDYKASWEYIADTLKNSITFDKYVELMKPFNKFRDEKGKAIDLFYSGSLFNLKGEQSPFYYYNFANDTDKPLKCFIYFTFPNTNALKLSGVKIKFK